MIIIRIKETWKIENANQLFDNEITEGFLIPSKFGFQRNVNKNLESNFINYGYKPLLKINDDTITRSNGVNLIFQKIKIVI